MAGPYHFLTVHSSGLWLVLSPQVSPKASLPAEADLRTERDNHLPGGKQERSATGHLYLQLWALSWLVTEEGMSLSSAGVDEVGTAHRFAAGGRVEPLEGSARGWWEGWAVGAACSQKSRVKAQVGEETKAPFFSLKGVEGNRGWNGTKTLILGGQGEGLTPQRPDLCKGQPTYLGVGLQPPSPRKMAHSPGFLTDSTRILKFSLFALRPAMTSSILQRSFCICDFS